MICRILLCVLLLTSFIGCNTPYKKKDKEEAQPLKHQAGDTTFLAFIGRLRIAVEKKDVPMIRSMMVPDFAYRLDAPVEPESIFAYWDANNLWPELRSILNEGFIPNGQVMVAPARLSTDPTYSGRVVGVALLGGSWKFAYFLPKE
ncbi:MAG: hypothetical protein V4710_17130 [Verrucomicrobiota bacterium]